MATFRNFTLPLVGGVSLLFLATPVMAQGSEIIVTANMKAPDGFEVVKLVVNVDDLDLSTPVGKDRMEKRIGNVIRRFCGPPPRAERWQLKDAKACSDFAWKSARPQMDEAVHKATGG